MKGAGAAAGSRRVGLPDAGGEADPALRHGAPLAVVSAIDEELRSLRTMLQVPRVVELGGRAFHLGTLAGLPVVMALSGIGKVAAATTATLLVGHFNVEAIVFTGVAGGLAPGVRVGDVVVADTLLQHDMDASPLFPRFEVPMTGRSRFAADPALTRSLAATAARVVADAEALLEPAHRAEFGIASPSLHRGLVVSGDRFVASAGESEALRSLLPDALAVEMEGAALAQVCHDFALPFAVLRTVSDRADDSAHVDFGRFVHEVASVYTHRIVHDWMAERAASFAG